MGFSETVPCQWCGKGLRVSCDTDGMGGLVESVADCNCPDARWRRGACTDCGAPVQRNSAIWPRWPKRCPMHDAKAERKRRRESYRRRYPEIAEEERARCRRFQAKQRGTKRYELYKRVKRMRHREGLRVRGKKPKRLPPKLTAIRNRLIYRLRVNEGWQHKEIAEVFDLTWTHVWTLVRGERERRENQQQERAA